MKLGEYAAAVGAQAQSRRLEVVANNMANANTPGYKKDEVHFQNYLDEATYTDYEQGSIKETGNKLDVALSGTGFMRVKTDQGVVYTRAGNLTLKADKTLATVEGWPVLGSSGPIHIEDPSTMRIEPDGQVFDKEQQVDTLDMVQFPPDTALRKVRNGYFEPVQSGLEPVKATDCTVKQGALEGANFNMVEEMVNMIQTMRIFEAHQKTIQTFDRDLDAQIISKFAMT